MSDPDTQPAVPFLSFGPSVMCVVCGRTIQHGERVELLCGGARVLPTVSLDGESMAIEDQTHEATFDLVHRECPE